MADGPYFAESAALIGDPARANMLAALMSGEAMTAGELGYVAGVAPSTASEHLRKLVEGRLLTVVPGGRHRYYRLASPAVAEVLEQLLLLSIDGPPRHRPKGPYSDALAQARTCYDHIAGRLGVAIADRLAEQRHIDLDAGGARITRSGRSFLQAFGVDWSAIERGRRQHCKACLDWSERRFHLGGAVGAALADRMFQRGWIERQRDSRALTVTTAGRAGLKADFDVEV